MGSKIQTVAELAKAAQLDLDEALVRLWDGGLPDIQGPGDRLTGSRLKRAATALSIPSRRSLSMPAYWKSLFDLDDSAFASLLNDLNINMSSAALRLPKGAIAKLHRAAGFRSTSMPIPVDEQSTSASAYEPVIWRCVGTARPDMRYLSEEQLLAIHECLVEDFARDKDPIAPPGVRDRNLLSSAASRPLTSLGTTRKYPTIEMASAALLHSLVLNHAFFNGNKRTALVSTLVFLDENHVRLDCREEELFKLVLQVAQHSLIGVPLLERDDREVLELAEWFLPRCRLIESGERVIKWVRLRRILSGFGCRTEFSGGVGNRIDIYRRCEVRRGMISRRMETRTLRSQVHYGGEGTEPDKTAIAKLRRDLHLDDEHGVDSRTFYQREDSPAQDFIVIYRKTLARLAKL